MNKPVTITTQIDAETHAMVLRVSEALGRSEAEFIAGAVERAAQSESDYLAFIQVGIDAADRGDTISQDEMERWFEERIAQRAAG